MVDFWKEKKVLVTGAGGFIASHLVEFLIAQGAHVRAFVRYNSRGFAGFIHSVSDDAIKTNLETYPGDLRDAATVMEAVRGMHYVFHLGALISIPFSYKYPDAVVETNIVGTMNVLQACRAIGVDRLIHTSTSEVYGSARYVPIDEAHPLQGQSPYSASKIGADKLAESFFCAYELPVITVRPFNTYGPRQSARAVIPAIISQVLTRDVLELGNLQTTRDFTFVSDTVAGFIKAAESPSNSNGEVFNLGYGAEISINELANEIIRLSGREVKLVTDARRLRPERSEVTRLLSNNSKAKELLGWEPQVHLTEGLTITIQWVQENLHLFQPGVYAF